MSFGFSLIHLNKIQCVHMHVVAVTTRQCTNNKEGGVGYLRHLLTSKCSSVGHMTTSLFRNLSTSCAKKRTSFGDKFGESLGGSQATPSFWEVPGLPRKFPKLPRKFFRQLLRKFSHCGTLQQSRDSPEVSQTSPEVPRTSPELSRTSPEVSPFSGKPDTLS